MISLFINNQKEQNKTVNSYGNRVTLNLQSTIDLDDGKQYQMRLIQSNIVYCSPNITTKNNKLYYKYNNVSHTITLSVGLYDIDTLNQAITDSTIKQAGVQKEGIIYFVADEATSKIKMYLSDNVAVTAKSNSNCVLSLLGFDLDDSEFLFNVSDIDDAQFTLSQQIARLNPITSILVRCNVTQGCSMLNSSLDNIIASIPINGGAWDTMQYSPVHPLRANINVKNIYQLTIELVDQNGNDLDFTVGGTETVPELWSVVLSINPVEMSGLL